jgi:hypothetical protein
MGMLDDSDALLPQIQGLLQSPHFFKFLCGGKAYTTAHHELTRIR